MNIEKLCRGLNFTKCLLFGSETEFYRLLITLSLFGNCFLFWAGSAFFVYNFNVSHKRGFRHATRDTQTIVWWLPLPHFVTFRKFVSSEIAYTAKIIRPFPLLILVPWVAWFWLTWARDASKAGKNFQVTVLFIAVKSNDWTSARDTNQSMPGWSNYTLMKLWSVKRIGSGVNTALFLSWLQGWEWPS